jgi:hypothetical protein
MKPLNYDNSPCSPISSNCVIWQGPDLHCIKLCTGDTVSDVVANLATELCTIMEQLDITNYDLSCFNLVSCPPNTFEALIQFLIEKICSLEGISSDPNSNTKSSTGCPDCLVSVASCFIVNNITSMQLIDYVNMIGQRVCNILTTITELQNQINDLDVRVTVLENASTPTFTLPTILVDCILQSASPGPYIGSGGSATAIDLILSALINDDDYGYCALRTSLGLPAELATAILSQCITSSSISLVYGTPMGTAYSGTWINTPRTIADTLTDMWISICDIFDYLFTILKNTFVDAGEGISVASATAGNITTYTVTNDYLETFVANLTINSSFNPVSGVIPLVTPSSVDGITDGQTIERYTQVSSNSQSVIAGTGTFVPNANLPAITFGSFNNTTGVFSITDPGTYLIKATIHLKPNNASTLFWSGPATFSTTPTVNELEDAFLAIGSFYIGITPDNTSDLYVADSQTLTPGIDRCVELSTSKVITTAVPIALKVKVLNTTNRSYNGTAYTFSDFINFSIIKLRTNLTITQL